MTIGLVNAQTLTPRKIIGLVSAFISLIALICIAICCLRVCLARKRSKALRQQVTRHPPVTTGSHVIYLLDKPSTVNSSSEATNTSTGVPHSTVPLESELQNALPPAYSTAHKYSMYTQPWPDEATSQNKNAFHGEEPTAEPPPE